MPAKTPEIVVIDDSPTSIHLYELSIESLDVDLRPFQSASKSLEYLHDEEFNTISHEQGLRTALNWRDARFKDL